LAENASDGIFIALGDGGYAYANRHASEITGYSISELLKTTIKDLAHPDELDKVKEIHRTIIEGKPFKSSYETMILRKDGTAVPLEVTSARTKWYNQPADIVIIRDIRERKRIEGILQESKAMLEAVIESIPFDVFALDHNNRYILQNSICKKNWGDLIGKSPEDIAVDKPTKDLWIENNRRAFSGETVTDEVVYKRLNGEKSYCFNIITPIRDGEKIFGILGVIIDISEIKKKEEALRVSEKRYRRLVETMNDGIGIQDENGLITYVNNRFCQMLDYKRDDFIGKPVTNFLDDHNRQILKNQTAVRRKGKVKPYEIEWSSKDGRKVQTIMSPQAIFNDEGQFKGSFSVITDISSLKQAERLLCESNERFRNLTEITSDWIWEVDKNGAYTYVSPKIFDILGYREEEVIGKTPFDLMPPAEAERVFKIFDTIRASQQPFDCLENINIHKNGRSVILETSGIPILDADGELCCYRGVDRDITRRKRVEEELRKARDELEIRVEERTRALEIQKSNLEEANIALQVLLDKRQEDKKEAEDNVLTNVKELIAPYFEKIKKTKLDNQQKAFLSIMESNLNEITSPFTRKMSLEYLNLTPTEIHVANLVRHGRNSKEIAELMGLSPRTIYNHRKNIRKKFGLENKKTDLRSYLLSIG
jgi:PAS domain S-box-containing protein